MPKLTQSRLMELLDYDPITGVFRWKVYRCGCAKAGQIAGFKAPHGYVEIGVDRERHYAHRLAWLYVYGQFPNRELDHKDGDGFNNAITNLREATRRQNSQNLAISKRNSSGYRGVSKKGRRWEARLVVNYKTLRLGVFRSPKKAYAAYLAAKAAHHPFQPAPRNG